MQRFDLEELNIQGLFRVKLRPFIDGRGEFTRIFCNKDMEKLGWDGIAQINRSVTYQQGVVRGLHFQKFPHAEKKIIMCESGEVWDIAVDIRRGSKTFLEHHAEKLTENSNTAIMIPEGFAHGFQAITDNVRLIYLHSAYYSESSQDGLNCMDPLLSIKWPLEVKNLSERDTNFKLLESGYLGIKCYEM